MKIVPHNVKRIFLYLGIYLYVLPLFAFSEDNKTTPFLFSCNPLVHVSFDNTCSALITPDMILEGVNTGFDDYIVSIEDQQNNDVPNPVTGNFLGETLVATVTYIPDGNSCWGEILMEDKTAPNVICFDAEVDCFQDINTIPFPPAVDNCDDNLSVNLSDEIVDASDPCSGVIITRVFVAIDASENESTPCTQIITTKLPPLPDFPDNAVWSCSDYNNHPNVTEATPLTNNLSTTGSGIPDVAIGNYCPYNVGESSQILPACGESFKIIRNWTVLNWCTGEVITQDINGDDNIQVIDVLDQDAPNIQIDSFTVSANISGVHPIECKSQDLLSAPIVTEECGDWTLKIFTPVGEAIYINGNDGSNGGYIPSPGLGLGFHEVYYEAIDDCGNVRIDTVHIEVIDDIAPIATCDELTEVALTIDGIAEVDAAVFDDGSNDNCCIDRFEIAPMLDNCGNVTEFSSTLIVCCEDVSEDPIQATVRVFDCAGNFNDCMIEIEVTDKINPELINCPPPQTIDCDFYKDNLETPLAVNDFSVMAQFGSPNFFDNCQLLFKELSVTENIDPCGEGAIVRRWVVTDQAFNTDVECTQFIFVEHVSDWVVQFPDDVLVTCTDTLPVSGEPEMFDKTCELIAVSYEDQQFNVVQDACFKIKRTWTVVNWCEVGSEIQDEVIESSEIELLADLNGNGVLEERVFQDGLNTQNFDPTAFLRGATPDGYITYEQVIKVIDDTDPIINCPPPLDVCIESNDCFATVELPQPELIDCSEQLTLSVNGDLGSSLDPYEEVPPGDYSMTYSVSDNCGNSNACQFDISVRDCKNPTPYCLNGLIVELQNGEVEIWAKDFDAGSFDNCSSELICSFSADTSDVVKIVDCFDIGEVIITIWVTDEAGNQALCETFVSVQDNMGSCMGPPLIAGTIENENGQGIKDVNVKLSGDTAAVYTTISDGYFEFENLSPHKDYTVTPEKDINYLNGVTTYDLVLISKHILGTLQLGSPYKIMAADVNNSKSVSTSDLVQIRRLILNIDTAFAQSPSWRFIEKDFVFQSPQNPFLSDITYVIDYNNLDEDKLDANFIGWKMGDVNASANPDNLLNSDDRNKTETVKILTDEKQLIDNELVSVAFFMEDADVLGFQYTLEFDPEKLGFVDFEEGILTSNHVNLKRVGEGQILMSWNGTIANLNEKLFQLNFNSYTTGNLSDHLKITSKAIEKEAYHANLEILDVELAFEKSSFELYQNTPNPFSNHTIISFDLEKESHAELRIIDTSGKEIRSISQDFEAGYHEVSFDLGKLNPGVYYYQLTTQDGSKVRKMVK